MTRRWVTLLAASVLLFPISQVFSQTAAIDKGVAFLEASQNEDGSWSEGGKQAVDTVEAARALSTLNLGADALVKARAFIADLPDTDNDKAARKLSGLSGSGKDTSALISALLATQNEDGGWGTAVKKESSITDTVLVVGSLLEGGTGDVTAISAALEFLLAAQETDGSFTLEEEQAPSDTARTALALIALKDIEFSGLAVSSELAGAVLLAREFLESKETDGSFGSIVDTALSYLALIRVKQPVELQSTMAVLLKAQQEDGSWTDVFDTALVLRTLSAVQPPVLVDLPELLLAQQGIVCTPSAPSPGDPVTIDVTVCNAGQAGASDVTVEAFVGDFRSGGTAIGTVQTIASIAPGGSGIVSFTLDTTGLSGTLRIFVVIDRTNAIQESDETNGIGIKELALDATPPPPATLADLTVSPEFIVVGHTDLDISPNVSVSVVVDNIGDTDAENVTVQLFDPSGAGTLIGETVLPLVAGNSQVQAEFLWQPALGPQTLQAVIDPLNQITEGSDANNSAQTVITLTSTAVVINLFKFVPPGPSIPAATFDAFDIIEIEVVSGFAEELGATSSVSVANAAGTKLTVRPKAILDEGTGEVVVVPNFFLAFPLNNLAAQYTVTAVVRAASGNVVLNTATRNFLIAPRIEIDAITLRATPFELIKGVRDVSLRVQICNRSNVDAEITINFDIKDPAGTSIFQGSVPHSLERSSGIFSVDLGSFTHDFVQSGKFTISGDVVFNATVIAQGTGTFQVENPVRIRLTKTVEPMTVRPLGTEKVQVKLKLERIDDE